MAFGLVLLVAGLLLLLVGADWMVRGSVRLAHILRLPVSFIGVVLVGFGTSTPELAVAVSASAQGRGGIAVGNIVGANVANILLVLGTASVLLPVPTPVRTSWRGIGPVAGGAVLFAALAVDGAVSRVDGLLLLVGFVLVTWYFVRSAMTEDAEAPAGAGNLHPTAATATFIVGAGGVVGGAGLLVTGAVAVAETLNVPDEAVGLTLIAIGTTLPELTTAVVATLRRAPSLALGNMLGSIMFNTLAIIGLAALISPLPVEQALMRQSIPIMLLAIFALFPITWSGSKVSRVEGAVLLAGYAAFIWLAL